MPLTILMPPAVPPVTLDQIRQHLRIDHSQDDDYLLELARAAAAHCEAHTRRCFIERTVRQYVDCVQPEHQLVLEAFPVIEVVTVTIFDRDGNASNLEAEHFDLKPGTDPAVVKLSAQAAGTEYPNGLEIDYRCGYGSTPSDIPANITRALLVLIGHWYEHRGTHSSTDVTALIPEGFERLLQPVRRVRL